MVSVDGGDKRSDLCRIGSSEDPQKFDSIVFKCLLRIIEIVTDLKYQRFQLVMDFYINETFSATWAYE